MPKFFRESDETSCFLLSPLVGAGFFLSFSVFLGIIFRYDIILLCVMLVAALIFVCKQHKKLYFPKEKIILPLILFSLTISAILSLQTYPKMIDGGIYFTPSAYDHVKCAIIRAISRYGLFPVNPWLADDGKPVQMVYYFGWHAFTAQIPMLTGIKSLFAEYQAIGLCFSLVFLSLCALLRQYAPRKPLIVCFFLILFLCNSSLSLEYGRLFPDKIVHVLTSLVDAGFWCVMDNFLWSPQHMFAGALVLGMLTFYFRLLKTDDKNEKMHDAILIAVIAGASCYSSVYAGAFALLFLFLSIVLYYCFNQEFRRDFNHAFLWQCLAGGIFLVLTIPFFLYLLSSPLSISSPEEQNFLMFSQASGFDTLKDFNDIFAYFISFYFYFLPMRLGLLYIYGMIILFIPVLLPKNRETAIARLFIFLSFLTISFVRSSFYSNDFGWRSIVSATYLLSFISALGLWIQGRKEKLSRVLGYAFILGLLAINFMSPYETLLQFEAVKYEPEHHKIFAKAIRGWDFIEKVTRPNDMVLCNPSSFSDIGGVADGRYSTNLFYSMYSSRFTPIGDIVFAKCYSEYYSDEKLNERYKHVCDIFAGINYREEDFAYLANELHVKALLVTPNDGLWNDLKKVPTSVFSLKKITSDFAVFWRD